MSGKTGPMAGEIITGSEFVARLIDDYGFSEDDAMRAWEVAIDRGYVTVTPPALTITATLSGALIQHCAVMLQKLRERNK